ncbi:MAG: sulfurtransferase [Planctomycetes bacterium]|nr:sulfurtransferase [Planctomycetota bacterium]MBI3848352.1 sulfurtransferase [Planctomycetota bacterium]
MTISPGHRVALGRTAILAVSALAFFGCCAASTRDANADAAPIVRAELERYYGRLSDRDWPNFSDHFWPGATITTIWQPPGESKARVVAASVGEFVAQAPTTLALAFEGHVGDGTLPLVLAAAGDGPTAPADPTSPIVDADWVRNAMASDQGIALVDVRDAFEYQSGHVKGAANATSSEFLATVDGLPGMMPPPEAITALARRLGVRRDRPVVVYGNPNEPYAARAEVTFRVFGHPRSYFVDGGIDAARKAGLPMSTAIEPIAPGDFTATAPAAGVVDGKWISSHLHDGNVVLVDSRTEREFDRGHIPGAKRVEWRDNLAGGRLRAEPELWKTYASCSLAPKELSSKTVVCYCAIGTRASVSVLALERLGFEHVLLYPGSWAEWSHGDFPIEKKPPDKK